MNAIAIHHPDDPAELGWPPTLPVEMALRVAPVRQLCEHYGISREEWDRLRHDPAFQREVEEAIKAVRKEGVSFKIKARLQAEALLKESWKLIHDKTGLVPAAVKADLIKFTVKAAGLDASADKQQAGNANTLNIQINL